MKEFRQYIGHYILGLALLLLSACSSTTFLYNRLPVFIPWYVEDYVDLDPQQNADMDRLLAVNLDRHRLEDLPRYIAFLDQAVSLLDGSITRAQIEALFEQSQGELENLQEHTLDGILAIGATLTDEQVADFVANLREKQLELEDKFLDRDDAEFRDDSYDSMKDGLSGYLGALEKTQKAVLKQASDQLQRWDRSRLADQENWVELVAVQLQRQPGWQDRVRSLVVDRFEMSSEETKLALEHNLGVTFDAVAAVINHRTERQDRRLRKKLAALRGDLCELIAQGYDQDSGSQMVADGCQQVVASSQPIRWRLVKISASNLRRSGNMLRPPDNLGFKKYSYRHQTSDIRHQTSDIRHQTSDIRRAPSTRQPIPAELLALPPDSRCPGGDRHLSS